MDIQNQKWKSDEKKSELYPFYIICDLVFGMRFSLHLPAHIRSFHSNAKKNRWTKQISHDCHCYCNKVVILHGIDFVILCIPFNQ